MSIQFLLDTDHLSLFQRQHPQVVAQVLAHPAPHLAITIITVDEQIQGRLAVIRRAPSELDVARGYARLGEAIAFFHAIQVAAYDAAAAERWMDLRRQKIRIGTQDLRIAAITLTLGATLVTRNTRDFAHVPGLVLADWSV